jgi:uncharacterized membrane protein YbaN (DUF454 family)
MFHRALAPLLWRALAVPCVALDLPGALLPGLPAVPFLLVAAWSGGRGWPALERRRLQHPRYGPGLREWRERREHGTVPRRANGFASTVLAFCAAAMWFIGGQPGRRRWPPCSWPAWRSGCGGAPSRSERQPLV